MLIHSDFEELYKDFFSDLVWISFRITGSQEASEDICQEAFLRLHSRLEKFPTRQDARYWLIRVAKNLSLNYFKRRKTERKAIKKVKEQPLPQMKTGEELLLEEESVQLVKEALNRLPEKFSQVLILKEYSDLSYREIGKIMGISEGNVKVRAFRARNMLEQLLNKEDHHVSK